jgi:ankyrin repeat protein
LEGSRAAAQSMTKFAERLTMLDKKRMLYHSMHFLVRSSNSEMLSWPNSPLLVLLQLVDPNLMFGEEEGKSKSPLQHLADLVDPSDYTTHVTQLILAKQLIEDGANVNAVSTPRGETPLHNACSSHVVTNLDFVEYLLKVGADPNAQDRSGRTPLLYTTPHAPGAAKFLLNWSITDVNITMRSGESFLARVRLTITSFSDAIALPGNPNQVANQFQLQQWREIEEMLVDRGAHDTPSTTILSDNTPMQHY